MILFEEALSILEKAMLPRPAERTGLTDCLGRILAEDIFSDIDMPPFDKSAVDGYACRKEDLHLDLNVLEVIAAGKEPQFAISKGECSKLMTGAKVPEGANTVIMIEDVVRVADGIIRSSGKAPAVNICYQAEDLVKGTRVLEAGTLIRPQEIAVLASVGAHSPQVFKPFRIGIITTGDELVEPDTVPGPSQIRNSNAWQLYAQVSRSGAIPSYYGIASDDEAHTLNLLEHSVSENDIVLMTGGVSVGDFDFVPAVLAKAGFDIRFRDLAVQPGKPSIFATRGETRLFALPGNPVSSFVQYELLVRHLMNHSMGALSPVKTLRLPLGFDYRRKRIDRLAFVPVRLLQDGSAGKVEYHGSAHIHSYIQADGIISINIGMNEIEKGTLIDVRLL